MNLLKTRHVGELVADKKNIIEVEKQAPIQEALRLMKENGIMTLPVYNATNHQYEGIIDLFDIMTLVAFGNFATVNPKEEYFKEFQFSSFRVFNLLNSVSKTHNVVALEGSETLQLAMKQLVDTQRILVHQPDDSTRKPVYRLLTQTDVVRFLYNNISSFKDVGSKPIIELEPTKTRHRADLTSTSEKEKTIEGFRKMWRENVHALPVLNEKGEIVATLSSSDLKELTPQKLQTVLFQPLEFLQAIHGGVKPAKPITCYQTDILEDVMLKALTAKVHRVWIVDSAQKPVGVLSYSDIINAFL